MDIAPAGGAGPRANDGHAPDSISPVVSALAGRYRVEREIGRGGMATIYLAEDLRHRRRVAVKVLHAELGAALGSERFLREIEVTAGLHHPHILPLHDSGEAGGLLYYVMPLVEGESLRQRMVRERQLPVDEAVRIAVHAASALDYAHRHGVVHRDFKPENVLLQDGEALVADFGIARAVQRAGDADTLTGTGMTLGTPQYMSPEQAAGERELDARTDVFALGCVLYEMIAGTPPFTAPTAQGVVAKLMTEEPRPLSGERRVVPAHVATAVHRALQKLPADRFSTAAQFAAALTTPLAPSADTRPESLAAPVRRAFRPSGRHLAWGALTTALAALTFGAGTWLGKPARPGLTEPVRFTLEMPGGQPPAQVRVSRDGKMIVFAGNALTGGRVVYVRQLDQLTAQPIAGTEEGIAPFFSPDGRWVAFRVRGQLKKVPIGGGTAVQVADSLGGGCCAWSPHDVIVGGSEQGLLRVPASGGSPERFTAVDRARGELDHTDPIFLPDGRTVAFRIALAGGANRTRLGLASADAPAAGRGGAEPHTTLDVSGGVPIGFVDGMLIVGNQNGTIMAVPVDLRRGRVVGEALPVLAQARGASLAGDGNMLAYHHGSGLNRPALVDERGAVAGGLGEPRRYRHPRVSPDGQRIALELGEEGGAGLTDIWVYDLVSGVMSRLTTGADASRPEWTPDGQRIAYITSRSGRPREVWWMPADQSGPEERLHALPDGRGIVDMTFSPNGRFAVLRSGAAGARSASDFWLLPLGEPAPGAERRATPLLQTAFREAMPRISPDGRWLAYVSDESGQVEVYVRPFPGPGGRVQVSSGGGTEPVWARDGRDLRLFLRSGDRFAEVTLATAPGATGVSVASRRVRFEGRYQTGLPNNLSRPHYDVLPDGKQFVVLAPEYGGVVVILNWLAELRSRTAAAGAP